MNLEQIVVGVAADQDERPTASDGAEPGGNRTQVEAPFSRTEAMSLLW